MDKKEFLKLYDTNSIMNLCEIMGCSQSTIYRLIKEHDLPLKQGRVDIVKKPRKFELK